MKHEKYLTLTEANFDAEVLSSSKPVLVDFWGAWCPPCRAIAPTAFQLVPLLHLSLVAPADLSGAGHQTGRASAGLPRLPREPLNRSSRPR